MSHAVSCPSCGQASRVLPEGLGRAVACPHCGKPFVAGAAPTRRQQRANPTTAPAPPRDDIPVVGRTRRDDFDDADPADIDPFETSPPRPEERSLAVVGLALVPLGIPLFWLVATLATGRTAIFSYVVPVSLAAGLVGLGLGVCYAGRFGTAARVRAVLALILVGYGAAGLAYFTRPEWVVALRRQFPGVGKWKPFVSKELGYELEFPGPTSPLKGSPLSDWKLGGFEVAPPGGKGDAFWNDRYTFALGEPPRELLLGRDDDEWFDAAKSALVEACGGEVTDERAFTLDPSAEESRVPGREYRVRLANGTTHRVVRIIRNRRRVYYLAVEGEFLLSNLAEVPKLRDVRRYLDSFKLVPAAPFNGGK